MTTDKQTVLLELVNVVKEQQELIAELLNHLPLSLLSEEIKASIDRIVAGTERIRENFADKAEIEEWAEERRAKLRGRGKR